MGIINSFKHALMMPMICVSSGGSDAARELPAAPRHSAQDGTPASLLRVRLIYFIVNVFIIMNLLTEM